MEKSASFAQLIPYLKLLKPVRGTFALAVFFALIFGVFSGFGLPFMTSKVFPLLFPESSIASERYTLAGDEDYIVIESAGASRVVEPLFVHDGQEWQPAEEDIRIDAAGRIVKIVAGTPLPWDGAELHVRDGSSFKPLVGGVYIYDFERHRYEELKSVEYQPPSMWFLLGASLLLPATFLIRGISGFLNTYLINYCGAHVLEELRMMVFNKLQSLPLAFFQQNKSGDLLSRVMGDTSSLRNVVTVIANDLIKQPITLAGAMGYLVYQSVQQRESVFILLCFAVIAVCVFPIRYFGRKLLKRAYAMQEQLGNVSAAMNENLSAVREVRAFNLQKVEADRFRSAVREYLRYTLKVVKYTNGLSPAIEFVAAIGIGLAIFYASKTGISLNDIIPLMFALYMAYDPVKKLGAIHNMSKHGLAAVQRLDYVLNQPDGIPDPQNPLPMPTTIDRISFEDVHFRYAETPTLQGLNLEIRGGEIVALVGHSGAGKSTFVNLLPRFYEVNSGNLCYNDTPISRILKHDLRESISLVSQDTFLFDDTIANNIRIGRPGAGDEEIEQAARKAHAHEFIANLPEGYRTLVGERGTRLSGGQKQRVAIARAFLKDAPIVILDEATSSLDAESEAYVQRSLETLVTGKTVFIIAHRFSTIRLATRILVFAEGRVVDDGKHDELMKRSPIYQELFRRQILHEE